MKGKVMVAIQIREIVKAHRHDNVTAEVINLINGDKQEQEFHYITNYGNRRKKVPLVA